MLCLDRSFGSPGMESWVPGMESWVPGMESWAVFCAGAFLVCPWGPRERPADSATVSLSRQSLLRLRFFFHWMGVGVNCGVAWPVKIMLPLWWGHDFHKIGVPSFEDDLGQNLLILGSTFCLRMVPRPPQGSSRALSEAFLGFPGVTLEWSPGSLEWSPGLFPCSRGPKSVEKDRENQSQSESIGYLRFFSYLSAILFDCGVS